MAYGVKYEECLNINFLSLKPIRLLSKINGFRTFYSTKVLFLHNGPNRSNLRFSYLSTENGGWPYPENRFWTRVTVYFFNGDQDWKSLLTSHHVRVIFKCLVFLISEPSYV